MKRATPHARSRKAYVRPADAALLTNDPDDVIIPEDEIALLPSDPAPLTIVPIVPDHNIPDKPPEIVVATNPSAINHLTSTQYKKLT